MYLDVVLTVSESKRLIAKGVAKHPAVTAAMRKGYVVVCKGSTNAYVVEELLGKKIARTDYVSGNVLPRKGRSGSAVSAKLPDVIFKDGKVLEGSSSKDIVSELGPGDVFIKGANALNYERSQAALLIGHPTGGTIGAAIGVLVARRVNVLIPVGLEKSIPGDLNEVAEIVAEAREPEARVPAFWPVAGEIITEIEALDILTGLPAAVTGAGGIGGAEGAVRLLLYGDDEEIGTARKLIDKIQGEPPFIQ